MIMQALLAAGANANIVNNVHFPAERLGENFIKKEGDISLLMAAVGLGHPRLRMSWGTPKGAQGRQAEAESLWCLSRLKSQ